MKKYDEDIPEGHPFAETRFYMCPRDQYLRDHGWAIASRPKVGEAVWEKGNLKVSASRALELTGWQ